MPVLNRRPRRGRVEGARQPTTRRISARELAHGADRRTDAGDARFVEKLTLDPLSASPADVEPLRSAGLSDEAIEEAIHVCALFNMYDRIADALGFEVPDAEAFEFGAAMLLKRGYQ